MDPQGWMDQWQHGNAMIYDIDGPTHKQGRNLDWFLSGVRVPLADPSAVAVPGADHVGIQVTRPTELAA